MLHKMDKIFLTIMILKEYETISNKWVCTISYESDSDSKKHIVMNLLRLLLRVKLYG